MEPQEKERLFTSLEKIERGIYGDPDNQQEGLMQKVHRHDKVLKPMEFFYQRPKLTMAIILGVGEVLLEANKIGVITSLISIFK